MEDSGKKVLALCPPNITAVKNGPNDMLGDRVHQLPTVQNICKRAKCFVWPRYDFTTEVFAFANGVSFFHRSSIIDVVNNIKSAGITEVVCLYGEPLVYPSNHKLDVTTYPTPILSYQGEGR